MIQLATREACTGCTACKATCPKNAIVMIADEEGFWRPQINREECVECHACERACPVLHPYNPDENPQCYAARVKDDKLRQESSSGGLFTALARPILQSGGIVFGCVWEKPQLVAIHAKAETEEELAAMRGSKYVQSDLRDTYREVKAALKQNRKVLFSGTPCQIAGLNQFLGNPNENLLTIEIICHGAPSPAVFAKLKSEIEEKHIKKLIDVNFREKKQSWRASNLAFKFSDLTEYREPLYANMYVKAFLSDLSLRPSCYQCVARKGKSRADITLGDFWGIEHVAPQLDDNRGVSVVLIHTKQGETYWNAIAAELSAIEVSYKDAVEKNPSYHTPVSMPQRRALFMQQFREVPIKQLFLYSKFGPWYKRLIRKILRIPFRVLRGLVKILKKVVKK